jgi:hypothetical protein
MLERRLGDIVEAHLSAIHSGLQLLISRLRSKKNRSNPFGDFKSILEYAIQLGVVEKKHRKILMEVNRFRVKAAHYEPPSEGHAKQLYGLLSSDQQSCARVFRMVILCYPFKSKTQEWDEARRLFTAVIVVLMFELESSPVLVLKKMLQTIRSVDKLLARLDRNDKGDVPSFLR